MTVKEYLVKANINSHITFVKAVAKKDETTPFYHAEYQTTPILDGNEISDTLLSYIVLNPKQPPIEWGTGSCWSDQYKLGNLHSLLVISEDDFALLYKSKDQREQMISFIDERIENIYLPMINGTLASNFGYFTTNIG